MSRFTSLGESNCAFTPKKAKQVPVPQQRLGLKFGPLLIVFPCLAKDARFLPETGRSIYTAHKRSE
jgi:hypothetical protein